MFGNCEISWFADQLSHDQNLVVKCGKIIYRKWCQRIEKAAVHISGFFQIPGPEGAANNCLLLYDHAFVQYCGLGGGLA